MRYALCAMRSACSSKDIIKQTIYGEIKPLIS